MSAPAPGMFTLPTSGQRVWVAPDARVWSVSGGRVQRTVVAKWAPDFRVTGNGEMWRALLVRWSAKPEATRLDFSGPCPEPNCQRPVKDLRNHICAGLRRGAA